ncbi:MAG: hypothetical protein IJV62_05210 [Eggerthellaceae bacterium]|nr:hypothetical protein [Eggerthellaceae bacterium]
MHADMKKITTILFSAVAAIIVFLIALVPTCSSTDKEVINDGAVEAAKNDTLVLKLDEVLFISGTGDERLDENQAIQQIEHWGGSDVAAQSDGSYTATFTSEAYAALKQEFKDDLDNCILGATKGNYPDVTSATQQQDYARIEVVVQGPVDLDALTAPRELGMKACMYRAIIGEKVACVVDVVDEAGKNLGTLSYPDQG